MSITQTKTQLVEALDLYEHLNSELNLTRNLDSYSEEEWQTRLRNLGLETVSTKTETYRAFIEAALVRQS